MALLVSEVVSVAASRSVVAHWLSGVAWSADLSVEPSAVAEGLGRSSAVGSGLSVLVTWWTAASRVVWTVLVSMVWTVSTALWMVVSTGSTAWWTVVSMVASTAARGE
ncbi:hypothetical protein NS14008_12435 [Nocardia seriolae]|nr:hypothetical protein NS14008_12435 [Nocardia seriolae]